MPMNVHVVYAEKGAGLDELISHQQTASQAVAP